MKISRVSEDIVDILSKVREKGGDGRGGEVRVCKLPGTYPGNVTVFPRERGYKD